MATYFKEIVKNANSEKVNLSKYKNLMANYTKVDRKSDIQQLEA
jgi:hypothetical protein